MNPWREVQRLCTKTMPPDLTKMTLVVLGAFLSYAAAADACERVARLALSHETEAAMQRGPGSRSSQSAIRGSIAANL